MRWPGLFATCGCLLAASVVSCGSSSDGSAPGSTRDAAPDAVGSSSSGDDAGEAGAAADAAIDVAVFQGQDAGPVPAFGQGGATCASAVAVPLDGPQSAVDLAADTTTASRDVGAPCATSGAEVFYKLTFSRRVFLYADTFGAGFATVLYLLDNACTPMTAPTMQGDALCSASACGMQQSQLVGLVGPGNYRLAVSGAGGSTGAATVHLRWALAPSGTVTELQSGTAMENGTTLEGAGNINGDVPGIVAAGPEDGFWWTSCPSAAAGSLMASTCGGTTWESLLEVQVPGWMPLSTSLDACGLQADLDAQIPSGAGLRVLTIDGQAGNDFGPYALSVTRP